MTTSKKCSILVSGGAGYIGSHAVLELLDAGWPVTVVDNLITGFRHAVPKGVPFYEGDVADPSLITRVFVEQNVGAVMHFAGSVVVPESVQDPLKYYDNNTSGTRTFIATCVANGAKHFIFSSTAAVYGTTTVGQVTENTPTIPINPYGWSKLMAERILADASEAHNFNYCILRYFNVAGADPKGRAGQSTTDATHLIKVACEAATGKRAHVDVYGTDFDTPDGTGVRDYIHVSDLAAAHLLALQHLMAAPDVSLILNCGYGRGYSVKEVLDATDYLINARIERRMAPRREGDPASLVSDPSLLRNTLPWKPRYSDLTDIVGDALAWERCRL